MTHGMTLVLQGLTLKKHKRFKMLRFKLKGCNRNMNVWYTEFKKDILCNLDVIDKHSEIYGLIVEDKVEQMELRSQLDRLLK